MTKVEILLSKTKILLLLLGSAAFVILGVMLIIAPHTFISHGFKSALIISLAGITSVIFFGLALIYGFRKLFDKTMGLTIDGNGITDNTNASSVGLINWKDITEIKTARVMSTRFLLIYTTNPGIYLDKSKGLKKKLMQNNMRTYGTPLSINSNTLKYDFDDLEKLLIAGLNEQHEKL
jgi:hypothetical protein